MLRLLKVVVQPVFVDDDGETLTEVTGDAVTVSGGQWRSFADDAFSADELAQLDAAYQQQQAQPTNDDR